MIGANGLLSLPTLALPGHFPDKAVEAQRGSVPVHSQVGRCDCDPDALLSDAEMLCGLPGPAAMRQLSCARQPAASHEENSAASRLVWVGGLLGEEQPRASADSLTLTYKVKVLILVSRKIVTRDPIRKNRIKPWN